MSFYFLNKGIKLFSLFKRYDGAILAIPENSPLVIVSNS